MKFLNKTVLITGASGGIGRALAKGFAREGAAVALVGRDKERTAEVARCCGAVYHSTLDITDPANCKKIIQDVYKLAGGLDVLINNAGAMFRGDIADTPDEEWLKLFDINVHAVFYLSKEAIKVMREHHIKGNIVHIASNSALGGRKGHIAYATTKGAVVQMARCMALDCAVDQIRVNAVCPGATDTSMPMSKHGIEMTRERLIENCRLTIPMQRMAAPEEVVSAVLFIASEESSYITGTTLSVDGGTTAG
ncbi:MAG: SDR family oxidoreductase [Cloacibacillus sp.]